MSQPEVEIYRRRTLRTGDGRAEDLAAVVALALQAPTDEISATALPYQLSSWALDDPENLALWSDSAGKLVAFALHQIPFQTLSYAVHPAADRARLETAIFRWGQARAHDVAAAASAYTYAVWPAERLESTRARLHAAGYTTLDAGKVFFMRRLDTGVEPPSLPTGFEARHLAGEREVEAATELLQTAFGITSVTEAWRRRILQQPQYRPELDVVIVAPDGQLAAFCLLWLHPDGGMGQIEPMATHPDYQRRGLGRSIISEGLGRLQELGVDRVFVGTSSTNVRSQALYQSAGFAPHHRCVGFQYTVVP